MDQQQDMTNAARALIHREATACDLEFFGIVDLDVEEAYAHYLTWLDQGFQAEMRYLEKNRECRRDPRRLLPGARSAVILGFSYKLPDKISDRHQYATPEPQVAQYARTPDYHRVLRRKAETVATALKAAVGGSTRVLVDSAPLFERWLASKVSLGFIGKNTCYIHPRKGSWFLLGEILTTHAFLPDIKTPVSLERKQRHGGCGPCQLCQIACPTGALDKDYTLDANRCISYWTIEHRGPIPERFWPYLARYYFGCDICQLACPYNKNAPVSKLIPRPLPSLFETAVMTQSDYEKHFGGLPMTRAKRSGLRRNALIAMYVTKDPRLDEAMALASCDPEFPVRETLLQIEQNRRGSISN